MGFNSGFKGLKQKKLARECLKKYYQKMFHYLLHLVCLNVFITYKKQGGSISRLDFLLILAESQSSGVEWCSQQLGVTHQNY